MKALKTWTAAAAMLALAGTSQASPMTLVDNGLGVLDSSTHLEWTSNMNLGGRMTWAAANAWIATLNTSNYAGHNDWRLPTLNLADTSCSSAVGSVYYGQGCTGGELSGLFVTKLGNKGGESVLNQVGDTAEQIANLALFSNVGSGAYWSGTEQVGYHGGVSVGTWSFYTTVGTQLGNLKTNASYAVAVRPVDVAASVPEPQTLALALLALGATVVARRRRPA
ncbi:DUF1566 domain-containing protein [Paucibacter sp. DJ1R-11]|uniref:Lcl C-terminal domain-containing protein n=1 Tax=Paucibacter sp. DJ1R-11 TaxID=2893556 RepID=UPI0021E4B7D2|nr:DUF1566 domain-containing protein [Paucibacter sp. DJ1R-11]MCV2363278.1 DUF1566 domain-containing protein [Paucibacter sp. DJ1R-11]